MANKQKRADLWQIDLAGLMVCIAASALAYFVGLGPLLEQRANITTQRGQLLAEQRESIKIEAALTTLKKKAIAVRQELTEKDIELESTDRLNLRLAELARVLGASELQIDIVNTGSISNGHYCDLVPIHVSGQSSFRQCAAGFRRLYKTLRDVSIVEFNLEGVPEQSEMKSRFTLDMFWYAAPASKVMGTTRQTSG